MKDATTHKHQGKHRTCSSEQANLEMLNDDIFEGASMICEQRGRLVESELDDWLQAKEELQKRRWAA